MRPSSGTPQGDEPTRTLASTRRFRAAERLAQLLDDAVPIPGTEYRIGLDPILGLLPGVGDGVSAFLGSFVVVQAAMFGAPLSVLAHMVLNLLIDTAVGAVPVLGDLFDVGWKANRKNVELIRELPEERWGKPRTADAVGKLFVLGVVAVLTLALGACIALIVWILRAVFS